MWLRFGFEGGAAEMLAFYRSRLVSDGWAELPYNPSVLGATEGMRFAKELSGWRATVDVDVATERFRPGPHLRLPVERGLRARHSAGMPAPTRRVRRARIVVALVLVLAGVLLWRRHEGSDRSADVAAAEAILAKYLLRQRRAHRLASGRPTRLPGVGAKCPELARVCCWRGSCWITPAGICGLPAAWSVQLRALLPGIALRKGWVQQGSSTRPLRRSGGSGGRAGSNRRLAEQVAGAARPAHPRALP
jgi:hypothetical protein